MMKKILKLPLSKAIPLLPALAFAFTVKQHITFSKFCTQTATPSTTTQRGVVTDFFFNKCGLTHEEIEKVLKSCNIYLNATSSQNLDEVLALLNGCGLTAPAQIRRVVLGNPRLFFLRANRNIQSKLSIVRTFVKEEYICKLVSGNARIINLSEEKLKSAFLHLQRLGIEGETLSRLVTTQPRLLLTAEEKVTESFKQAEDLGLKKGSTVFAYALQAILGLGKEKLDGKRLCLSSLGFSEKQVSDLLRRHPLILGLSEEKMKRNVDFLVNSVGLQLDDFVHYPFLFGSSLEKKIIPQYGVAEALKSMQVLKTEIYLPPFFKLPEKRFLEKYVYSNAKSSVLLDIYHCAKAGKLSTGKDTSSESDVGPRLEA
jgi:mTERF domain-containing protein